MTSQASFAADSRGQTTPKAAESVPHDYSATVATPEQWEPAQAPNELSASNEAVAMAADQKQFATLQAHAALRGYVLERAEFEGCPAFAVGRWGLVKHLSTLAEVREFLDRVGAGGRDGR